nr:hypothetical protein [Tanacetum cinerariifolium]
AAGVEVTMSKQSDRRQEQARTEAEVAAAITSGHFQPSGNWFMSLFAACIMIGLPIGFTWACLDFSLEVNAFNICLCFVTEELGYRVYDYNKYRTRDASKLKMAASKAGGYRIPNKEITALFSQNAIYIHAQTVLVKKPSATPAFTERIDKLTRSIENAQTGESFPTEVRPLSAATARKLKGWAFEWGREAATSGRQVYQLNTLDNPTVIQGLISLEAKPDHVFMHLVESANFNKGSNKPLRPSLSNIIPAFLLLSTMSTATTHRPRRKLGHEPPGIDLTPIVSRPYTEEEEREVSAFFQKLRAENDKNPEIVALRERLAQRYPKQ